MIPLGRTSGLMELMEDEVALRDYWVVIKRHRRTVLVVPGIVAAVTGIWTLCFVPRTYLSTTALLMPLPLGGGGTSALQQLAGNIPGGLGALVPSLPGGALDTYKAILDSATVAERVNAGCSVPRWVHSVTKTSVDPKAQLLRISVMVSGTPQLPLRRDLRLGRNDTQAKVFSQKIARAYVRELGTFIDQSALFKAKQNRVFVQEQKAKAEAELRKAEAALAAFQQRHRTVSLPDEIQATLKSQAELEADRVAADVSLREASAQIAERLRQTKAVGDAVREDSLPENSPAVARWVKMLRDTELDLSTKKHQFADEHPEVKRLRLEVEAIKRNLREEVVRIQRAANLGVGADLADLEVSRIAAATRRSALSQVLSQMESQLTSLPPTMTDAARLKRDLEVKEEVFKLLAVQEVNTRIAEARDVPKLQVLDEAKVPEAKCKPSAVRNTMLAGITGLFLTVMGVFVKDSLQARSMP